MVAVDLDDAVKAAIELRKTIEKDSVDLAYSDLEKAVRQFESGGYPLESIIPQGQDAKLGFSLKRADGKTFCEIYSDMLRKRLCSPGGEFHKLAKSGINSSVSAILTAIVSSLGIPMAALGIIIPIAVIIAYTGLDAFCECAKPK
jgi:hypothetical protein